MELDSMNRPGGHGKIIKVDQVGPQQLVKLDVKYTLGGADKGLDPCLVERPQELVRGGRERKRRTLLTVTVPATATKRARTTAAAATSHCKENRRNAVPVTVSAAKKPKAARRRRKKTKAKVVRAPAAAPSSSAAYPRPDDLPREIVIRHSSGAQASVLPATSPMTEKGVEEVGARSYMLPAAQRRRSSPSSHYASSDAGADLLSAALGPNPSSVDSTDSYVSDDEEASFRYTKDKLFSTGRRLTADQLYQLETEALMANEEEMEDDEEDDEDEASPMPPAPTKRVTMKSVIDGEMEKASNFVNNVLQSKPGEPPKESKKPPPPKPSLSPRQQALMLVFQQWMDHNEGSVEEEDLLACLNARRVKSQASFDPPDVEALLTSLCATNKVMRCDGNIYSL
jgi:hypothetical protein